MCDRSIGSNRPIDRRLVSLERLARWICCGRGRRACSLQEAAPYEVGEESGADNATDDGAGNGTRIQAALATWRGRGRGVARWERACRRDGSTALQGMGVGVAVDACVAVGMGDGMGGGGHSQRLDFGAGTDALARVHQGAGGIVGTERTVGRGGCLARGMRAVCRGCAGEAIGRRLAVARAAPRAAPRLEGATRAELLSADELHLRPTRACRQHRCGRGAWRRGHWRARMCGRSAWRRCRRRGRHLGRRR